MRWHIIIPEYYDLRLYSNIFLDFFLNDNIRVYRKRENTSTQQGCMKLTKSESEDIYKCNMISGNTLQ